MEALTLKEIERELELDRAARLEQDANVTETDVELLQKEIRLLRAVIISKNNIIIRLGGYHE